MKANLLESEVIYPMTKKSLEDQIITVATRHSMKQQSSIETTINQANTMASCEPTVKRVEFNNEVLAFYVNLGICFTCSGWTGLSESTWPSINRDDIGNLRCICDQFETHQF
tara:strand:- start:737 stop:1072 length:336 start_codon:yes stop_codon:yes gene_type:complete